MEENAISVRKICNYESHPYLTCKSSNVVRIFLHAPGVKLHHPKGKLTLYNKKWCEYFESLTLKGSRCNLHFYRPQRSWATVMFLQASVILSTGRGVCLSACWDTTPTTAHSPRAGTPNPGTRSPGTRHTPPGADPLWTRPPREQTHPLGADPPEQTPPGADPQGSRLRDTVNERPVRILLECILVINRSGLCFRAGLYLT